MLLLLALLLVSVPSRADVIETKIVINFTIHCPIPGHHNYEIEVREEDNFLEPLAKNFFVKWKRTTNASLIRDTLIGKDDGDPFVETTVYDFTITYKHNCTPDNRRRYYEELRLPPTCFVNMNYCEFSVELGPDGVIRKTGSGN